MNIYESISKALTDVGAIGKTKWNDQQKFKFRGIDDVMNSLHPVLEKNKIFVVPEVLEQIREDRVSGKGNPLIYSICKIKYTFYAEDGSSITAVVIGEGMDSGDKATNKAMSIAFKYALFQIFCIPTEEMNDPDGESHTVQQKPHTDENEPISTKDVEALKKVLESKQINVEFLLNLYKLPALEKTTKKAYANIMKNIDKIKEKQEEKK